MTLYKCKECEESFASAKGLHLHLKKHKIAISDYYHKHFPRFDLYSRAPINFKSCEQYFDADFNSSSNFRKWTLCGEKEEVKKYLSEKMRKKLDAKGSAFVMGEAQLASYGWPTIKCIKEVFGTFAEFCQSVGLPPQFGAPLPKKFHQDFSGIEIWVDTREQKPLKFFNPVKSVKLDCGDYTVGGENFSHTFVDRKSPEDFLGTMSRDLDRFKRELTRCCDIGGYMFIVVDGSMSDVARTLAFSRSKTNIQHVWHNMREILNEFCGDCQFVFSGGRSESAILIPKLLMCGKDIWKTDVQFFIDNDESWKEIK